MKYNHINFHRLDGAGYEFLREIVLTIDKINPHVAARLVQPLIHWRRYDNQRQELMQVKLQLQQILQQKEISKNLFEVVNSAISS